MLRVEISRQSLLLALGLKDDELSIRDTKGEVVLVVPDNLEIEATRVVALCGGCCACPHGLGAEVKIVEPKPLE